MKKISIFLFSLLFVALIGCSEDDYVCDCIKAGTGGEPVDTTTYPVDTTMTEVDTILVSPLIELLEEQGMPVYTGTTPPDVSGSYLISTVTLILSNIADDEVGDEYNDAVLTFSNYQANKLLITQTLTQSNSVLYGEAAQISGSGNNFTVAHTIEGTTDDGVYTKMAVVCSATKTSAGLTNLWYAYWMREKRNDTGHNYMDVGDYRVITDKDGLAVNYTLSGKIAAKGASAKSGLNLFSIIR